MTNLIQNNINIKSNNYKDIYETGKEKLINKQSLNEINLNNDKDSIEVKVKDEEIINLKKSKNAWDENIVKFSPDERIDIISTMLLIKGDMEREGKMQGFAFNVDGKASYKDFINKILEYKDKPINDNFKIPSYFFDFCDKYKESLIKYDCK